MRRGSKLNMQDKVVMGDQNYGLRGLTRFSDNEGDIIWPAWRAELKQLVKYDRQQDHRGRAQRGGRDSR